MTSYASMIKRIRAATTLGDIKRIETSVVRLYEAGIFTDEEFYELTDKVLVCRVRIESEGLTPDEWRAVEFDEWLGGRTEQYLDDDHC
tara:strand:- start:1240 stop:1503 length:264 start_codon:yes stop_codon:yes gene_type:complete